MKTGDFARIVKADFPVVAGELPYQTDARLMSSLGLDSSRFQEEGVILGIEANGDVRYQDWQKSKTVVIPAKHVEVVVPTDVKDQVLVPGDTVWLTVKNVLREAVYVGPTGWSCQAGLIVLGARFKMKATGTNYTHNHVGGRLKV